MREAARRTFWIFNFALVSVRPVLAGIRQSCRAGVGIIQSYLIGRSLLLFGLSRYEFTKKFLNFDPSFILYGFTFKVGGKAHRRICPLCQLT